MEVVMISSGFHCGVSSEFSGVMKSWMIGFFQIENKRHILSMLSVEIRASRLKPLSSHLSISVSPRH